MTSIPMFVVACVMTVTTWTAFYMSPQWYGALGSIMWPCVVVYIWKRRKQNGRERE